MQVEKKKQMLLHGIFLKSQSSKSDPPPNGAEGPSDTQKKKRTLLHRIFHKSQDGKSDPTPNATDGVTDTRPLPSEDSSAEGQVREADPSESQDPLQHSQPSSSIRAQNDGGSPASRPSDGAVTPWKQEIGKAAKTVWQGLHKLTTIITPMVPEPFKGPLELFNTISDVAVRYIENEETLKSAMKELSDRLVEANSVLLEADNYDIDIVENGRQLAKLIVAEAVKIHEIQSLHRFTKTVQQDDIARQITACLDRLNQGTEKHHRKMTLAIARVVYRTSQLVLASTLSSFARSALFDADAATGGPARRACAPNTRVGLMDRLKQWALDTSLDSSPIFWLGGMAGSGKSTIAYTLCQHLRFQHRLGASFFCSRNHEQSRSRASIIPTIVRQLLHAHKPFTHSLRDLNLDDLIPASARHVDELLVQPWLRGMALQPDEQPPLVIVIDALDEIEGNDQGPQLIKQLIQAVSASETRLRGLKIFVTSRPHPRIVEECSSIDAKAVYHMEEIAPNEAFEDVRLFVRSELPELPSKKLEGIVTNSAGIFIYAATVVRYLCPPNFPLSPMQQQERLNMLETTGLIAGASDSGHELLIDSLYKSIIAQALPNVGREVETSKRVLYAVITTRRPLTVSDLAPLVVDATKKADEVAVRNSLGLFHAVLYVSPRDKCIYTFHKSFADFILDRGRSPELSNAATSYFLDRTQDCFRIMNKSLRFNICNLASSFLLDKDDKGLSQRVETNIGPELRYACQHWAAHLASVRHDYEQDVQQLSAVLLDFCSLKVVFWMEAMNLLKSDCRLAIHLARTWALQVQNPELNVYMAATQRLWASFIHGQASRSTPHLYISCLTAELALTSAVDKSSLRKWRKHFPGLPSVKYMGIFGRGLLMSMEGHSGQVKAAAFSPDGARVVSGSDDQTVRIWDATMGVELTKMDGHRGLVRSVAFSPDGARVVSGSDDETVRIWDATTGAELTKMNGHNGKVYSVAFSTDGVRIVSGSDDETVCIWNAETGASVMQMKGHSNAVYSVAFSPDGAQVVSGSSDKTVRIWDATTGAQVTEMQGHSDWVRTVAFSPDGEQVVSGSDDKTVRIWDVMTGAEATKIEGHSGEVYSVAFSPDGVRVVSGSDDKTVQIWNAKTAAVVTQMGGHSNGVYSVAFSPDGAHVVSGSGDKTMRIWDVTVGAEPTKMEGHSGEVSSIAFSPDSMRVVSGSGDKTVRIWDATTGAELTKMDGHSGKVCSVAFSPNGACIVSGSVDNTVRIWDVTTGAETARMQGHSREVYSVAFSPDGACIVSGSVDNTVRIWDVTTGAETARMQGHSREVYSVAFSPDGVHVVSGSGDKTVRIWNTKTGAAVTKMGSHSGWVYSVAFSPHNAHVVSGSDDKTVRIWDVTTGAQVMKMQGHDSAVDAVAFSPDGARVVSGSDDKTVRIWDATTGAQITKMQGHSGWVRAVAFSPDSEHVVSGSDDKTMRIWDVTTGATVEKMEGAAFLPDVEHVSGPADKAEAVWIWQRLMCHPSLRISHLWIFQRNGWVVLRGHPHIRLFWHPPELQPTLLVPHCLHLISTMGQTHLEFDTRTLGPDWQQIYHLHV
ncbi:WD40 repeat-like protein [Mycena venus]|uniref:WD40 repeat-like protein n=1 Tax=Mycena venus TaxID=2733690 RepID=A0A8H7DEC8_9AGAR|nr:WD40 repeat-like protein [Mycena venus]